MIEHYDGSRGTAKSRATEILIGKIWDAGEYLDRESDGAGTTDREWKQIKDQMVKLTARLEKALGYK